MEIQAAQPRLQWWFSFFTASIAIAIGVLVLIGWHSDYRLLVTGLPELPLTHPLAALWLLLMGCALALLTRRAKQPWSQRSAGLLLSLTFLTAGLTICGHLFGWLASSSRFLYLLLSVRSALPDRPAMQTTISVCCLTIALIWRLIHPKEGDSSRTLALLLAFPILVPLHRASGGFSKY